MLRNPLGLRENMVLLVKIIFSGKFRESIREKPLEIRQMILD